MIGIIGGSGLDNPTILSNPRDETVETPWGEPHSPIRIGSIGGVEVALVARHGRQHTVPPTLVNNRAHIRALVDLGCSAVLATTAVGSLREEIDRGDLVIPDQFIDFTRLRPLTFFEEFEPGNVRHTPTACAGSLFEDVRKPDTFIIRRVLWLPSRAHVFPPGPNQ